MSVSPHTINTTCPYCGVGCGVSASFANQQLIAVTGDEHHPANAGRLCIKGSSLHETVDTDGRLLYPQMAGKRTHWDQALNLISDKLQQVIRTHGPDAVAFYGSGQLLTEDYYVANKLMKGFIGSANMDTNSRLCMASAVVGYKRAFGSDTVPGCYEDFECTDLILLVGSNAAWAHPVLFQRIRQAKANNPDLKVVVIDPRRTATCDIADLHLAIRPGADGYLFSGLLAYLAQHNHLDTDFIRQHTEGFEQAVIRASEACQSLDQLAACCDLDAMALETCFQWFANSPRTVTAYSMGINQSCSGSDKANAIINVHLATGKIGKPGCSPFSITGQPNAMGGREVGGLANQLAAHMDFSAPERERLKRFWQSPQLAEKPGLKAIELFQAAARGEIKFLWIMSTNPMVSMPDTDLVQRALEKVELVVVSDCMADTDTTAMAHVLLPAASWGEKNGTVTNSERCLSRQRGFLPSPGEAKPDWWILTQVAHRLGFGQQFPYQHAHDIFSEHARLSGFENMGSRDFDISALAHLSRQQYDALSPIQWPVNSDYPNGRQRFFEDGRFYTDNGKARFIATCCQLPQDIPATEVPTTEVPTTEVPTTEVPTTDIPTPLNMNSGRIRDQWHTMTRTGKSARLAQHIAEPFVQLNPEDARRLNIRDQSLVEVSNAQGKILVRAQLSSQQKPGETFVPMHWSNRYSKNARIAQLINTDHDPLSGQPELKITAVTIQPAIMQWHGVVFSVDDMALNWPPDNSSAPVDRSLTHVDRSSVHIDRRSKHGSCAPQPFLCDYWSSGRNSGGHHYHIAGNQPAAELINNIRQRWHNRYPASQWITLHGSDSQQQRLACLVEGKLIGVVFLAGYECSIELNHPWITTLLQQPELSRAERLALLSGRPPGQREDPGAIICSCFQVGEHAIRNAIASGATSPEQLGQQLRCGTNCGSCVPELAALVGQQTNRQAALANTTSTPQAIELSE